MPIDEEEIERMFEEDNEPIEVTNAVLNLGDRTSMTMEEYLKLSKRKESVVNQKDDTNPIARDLNVNGKFTYLDLFSGIGGFCEGLKLTWLHDYAECSACSEIDERAHKVYTLNGHSKNNLGDITKIEIVKENDIFKELKGVNGNTCPKVNIIFAGFPCQAFSITGKKLGFEDARGTLFFDVARIAKEMQPEIMLLENVKGLTWHNKGETFKTILSVLDEIGYNVKWKVINSKFYGVPQTRERVYIVCYRKGITGFEKFTFPYDDDDYISVLEDIMERGKVDSKYKYSTKKIEYIKNKPILRAPFINKRQIMNEISNHTPSNFNTGRLYDEKGISGTITTSGDIGSYQKMRRFTEKELFKIQGFRGDYKFGDANYRQVYKMVGNSVCPRVIKQIFNQIIQTW